MKNYKEIKQLKNLNNSPNLPWQTSFEVYQKIALWSQPFFSKMEIEHFLKISKKFFISPEKEKIDKIIAKKQNKNSSWLWQWWINYIYLSGRKSPTPEVNAPFLNLYTNSEKYNYLEILSITINRLVNYYLNFYNKTFKKQENSTVFSDQVYGLFASQRIPKENFDEYYINEKLSRKIIFMYQNTSYAIDIIENNKVPNPTVILNTLKHIIKNHKNPSDSLFNYAINLNDRDYESKLLQELLQNEANKTNFNIVKNSIGVFTFDDNFNSKNIEEIFHNSVANDIYLNRWSGKSLQLTIDKNKNMVLLIDHSFVDAATYGEIFNEINQEFKNNIDFFKSKSEKFLKYKYLIFETKNKDEIIKNKFKNFINYKNSVYKKAIEFNYLKRSELKKMGVKSIDAFLQIGYQLAQYLTNKKIRNTYVAVDMRKYFGGRTECIRPVSSESLTFITNFDNYLKNPKEAVEIWNNIQDIHYKRAKQTQIGEGVNRHILGLSLAMLENSDKFKFTNLSELLNLDIIKNISSNFVSTSTINYEPIKYGYFYPVEKDGIGIFYITADDVYRAMITSWQDNKNYLDMFVKNLDLSYKNLLFLVKCISKIK